MKNVAHYQSESQTMNTTTCLILITATLLAAAKGSEVGSFDNPTTVYYKDPVPTSTPISINCEKEAQLKLVVAESKDKTWFLRLTTIDHQAGCTADQLLPVDRSMYSWRPASLPLDISFKGQHFVLITPKESMEDGATLWIGRQKDGSE